MFRHRHTSVAGLPRCGSIAACHALRPTPPSSNRTCRFPASGSPDSSRLRHSQALQIHQTQSVQVGVQADAFGWSVGSLAATFQVAGQALHDIPVDLAKAIRG